MPQRLIDFDQFRKEAEGKEPIILRIFGEDLMLPPVLPAQVMVTILRAQEEYGTDAAMPPFEIMHMARALLGAGVLDKLLANPSFSVEDLGELIKRVMVMYTGETEEAKEEAPFVDGQAPPASS